MWLDDISYNEVEKKGANAIHSRNLHPNWVMEITTDLLPWGHGAV